jgi:hypothetical protein
MPAIVVETPVRMPPPAALAGTAASADIAALEMAPGRFRKAYDVFEDVGLLLLGAFFLPVVILVLGSPLALLVQGWTALFGR